MPAEPTDLLRRLHERLVDAVAADDEEAINESLVALDDHLGGLDDAGAAVGAFDDLVDEHVADLQRLELVDLAEAHQAVVQYFYCELGLVLEAATRALARGELLLDEGRGAEAVEFLQEAHDALADFRDVHGGYSALLLAEALWKDERRDEAATRFGESVALSEAEGLFELAAAAADRFAVLLVEQQRHDEAAGRCRQAAELWRQADRPESAVESIVLAGWIDAERAGALVYEERYDEAERIARRAYEIGAAHDRRLRAHAGVSLGATLGYRVVLDESQRILDDSIAGLDPDTDGLTLAKAHLALGGVHAHRSSLNEADSAFRAAVILAEKAGDRETAAAAFASLDALAPPGVRPTRSHEVPGLHELVGHPSLALLADQSLLAEAAQRGDHAEVRRLAQDLLERTEAIAGMDDQVVSLHGTLCQAYLMENDRVRAEWHLRAAEVLVAGYGREGRDGLVKKLAPFLLCWRGLAALADGDEDRFADAFRAARAGLLAAGSTLHAARLGCSLAALALRQNRPHLAVEHAVPAVLALADVARALPSSAERASFAASLTTASDLAFRAVAATGDTALLAEFLEIVRSQSIPIPTTTEASGPRSVDALLRMVAGIGAVPAPTRADGHQGRFDAQETVLRHPAKILMPWGRVALAAFMDSPLARGSSETEALPTVALRVPR